MLKWTLKLWIILWTGGLLFFHVAVKFFLGKTVCNGGGRISLTDGNRFNWTESREESQLTDSLASSESRHHLGTLMCRRRRRRCWINRSIILSPIGHSISILKSSLRASPVPLALPRHCECSHHCEVSTLSLFLSSCLVLTVDKSCRRPNRRFSNIPSLSGTDGRTDAHRTVFQDICHRNWTSIPSAGYIIRIGQDYISSEYEQVPTSSFGENLV